MKCDCNCRTCAKSSRMCTTCPFNMITNERGRCVQNITATAKWVDGSAY
mgnify:CR=1 FL=1